ncbi:sulfite exporter TauE/SafE family protein [Baia soyae]|uniref:Probable membrane transporter protein n=1 Tax=Baia soyae TaxID=1544746 RepID=A0A4R2RZJ0_9BACL|nr:sulfite exporter TauE/SafE family protein [Baia soyae]TCP68307.1 hypothetical protein EDD57_11846 [Baia soyae]
MDDILIWGSLLLVGYVAGTIGSIVGLGGGIIIVPALLYLAHFFPPFRMVSPPMAVGTSLFLIVITSLSSTLSFHKQKRIDFTSGWLFFLGCGPGAMIGAYLSRYLQSNFFLIGFGLFMLVISFVLVIKDRIGWMRYTGSQVRTHTDPDGYTWTYGYNRWLVLGMSFPIGILSGLLGIGGGALMVPIMLIVFRFPPHVATATSMFAIFLSSILGSGIQAFQAHIHWMAVLLLAPGSWLGGKTGAWISSRLESKHLLRVFEALLVVIAIKMIYDGFTL